MLRSKLHGWTLSFLLLLVSPIVNADVLEDILDRQTLSGELIGFEVDVARKIADDMSVTPEFTVYEWQKVIPALQRGEIDVIAAGMAITPARALQVNFSRPLATSGISLATNTEKTRNVTELRHLNDERVVITVVADTLALSVAQTFFDQANIKIYPTSDLERAGD
jgi:polar amino acid transport system substrate-binding protein